MKGMYIIIFKSSLQLNCFIIIYLGITKFIFNYSRIYIYIVVITMKQNFFVVTLLLQTLELISLRSRSCFNLCTVSSSPYSALILLISLIMRLKGTYFSAQSSFSTIQHFPSISSNGNSSIGF